MRKLFLFTTVLFLCSCTSKEEKARNVIENYLKTTMNDWSSYEFIEMTPLDSAFTEFKDSEYIMEHRNKIISAMNKTSEAKKKLSEDKDNEILINEVLKCENTEDSLMNVFNIKKQNFKGDFIGFTTNFKLRGANKLGAKVISEYKFIIDKSIKTVTSAKEINE